MYRILANESVQAFVNTRQGGNRSHVVVAVGEEDPGLMRHCCAKSLDLGCEVTLVLRAPGDDAMAVFFFAAGQEISFCGHGTLAALDWMARYDGLMGSRTLRCRTASVDGFAEADGLCGYYEEEGQFAALPTTAVLLDQVRSALGWGCEATDDFTLAIGGQSRLKLLVQVRDVGLLERVEISPDLRDHLCDQLQVTGFYLYSLEDAQAVLARHFPKAYGEAEDIATGNIAPTIARRHCSHWQGDRVGIFQGGSRCNQSHLILHTEDRGWWVSGHVLPASND